MLMSNDAADLVTFGTDAQGYLAKPESGTGPGVVVIQEWWGLNAHVKDLADRFAAEGFVALAPDLFGGRTTHDADEAGQLMQELPAEQAAQDLGGAVDYLLGLDSVTSSKVGVVGFCMGGGFVLLLAAQQGDKVGAAVPFYGVGQGVPDSYRGLTAPVLGHYGEQDSMYPPEAARATEEQIRSEAGVEVTFHLYPAGHAFHNDQNPLGTYDEQSAKLAWSRTVEFLKDKLS